MVNKQFDQISQIKLMNSKNLKILRNYSISIKEQRSIRNKHYQLRNKHLQVLIQHRILRQAQADAAFSKASKKLR